MLLSTIALALQLIPSSAEDFGRPTRIIGGGIIYKSDNKAVIPWKAMYYYVWYGYTFHCYQSYRFWQVWSYIKTFARYGLGCSGENPNNLICHGTLISPKIVQTACHCLIYQVQIPTGHWSKAIKMTEFENKFTAFVGEVDVNYFDWAVKTEKFVIHQRCGQLQIQRQPRYWRYDIGWIVLEKEIHNTPGAPNTNWGRVQIAGPYKSNEITSTYERTVTERHVCLILGFGSFQSNSTKKSENLKYAWIQLLDDGHCRAASWQSYGLNFEIAWNEARTWVCAVPVADRPRLTGFPMGGQHGYGDSGGPVSCDNNYFAVLSSENHFKQERGGYLYMMFEMPIKYVLEANAVEYRRSFELDVTQYNQLVLRDEVNQGRKLKVWNGRITSGYTNAPSLVELNNDAVEFFIAKSKTQHTGHTILVLSLSVSIVAI